MSDLSRRLFVAVVAAGRGALRAEPRRVRGLTPPRLFDPERAMPALARHRRAAVRLHPRRAAAPLPAHASKMGGALLWPAAEKWPFCSESDPVDIPFLTDAEILRRAREMKLVESLARRPGALPPPPRGAGDTDAWLRWNRESQLAVQAAERAGLPALSPAEIAEARRQHQAARRSAAELAKPHNAPYQAIVQLRRDEFPELPWPPQSDIFQLLWCPRVHFWGNGAARHSQSPGARLYWRRQSALGPLLSAQPAPHPNYPVYECAFDPESTIEYPQMDDAPDFIAASLPNLQGWFDSVAPRTPDDPPAAFRYSYDLAAAPGTKILGYPQWIQGGETPRCLCGRLMRLLLTCASQEDSSSRVWTARTSHAEDDQNPSGFSWGDWSNAYVFFCASGHTLRTRTLVQSS